jgi:hypothetical protein
VDAFVGENMDKRNLTTIGILAVIAIAISGIGFALALDTETVDETLPCNGTGPIGLLNGRGFWSRLTEEQANTLAERTQEMLAAGASHDEIIEMKAALLEEWGIDTPQWSGPHYGAQAGGYGKMLRDGSGSGQQYGGRGNGGMGRGYNGECPYTN